MLVPEPSSFEVFLWATRYIKGTGVLGQLAILQCFDFCIIIK